MTNDKAIKAAIEAVCDTAEIICCPQDGYVLGNPDAVARAALAAAEAEAWRPIAEAPRDGTWVLVCDDERQDASVRQWRKGAGDRDPVDWYCQMACWRPSARFTHWRPLPAPPTQKGPPGGVAD